MADRLRILLAIEAAGGGAGRHVLDLATELIALRHEVHLAYSPIRAESRFLRVLESIPEIQSHAIDMHRGLGIHDLGSLLALRSLLRRLGRFDIIHGHSSKAGALCRIGSVGLGAKTVYTPHALVTLDPNLGKTGRFLYSIVERLLAGLGDRVICVSEEELQHALTLGLGEQRCVVVHNGLSPVDTADRHAVRKGWGVAPTAVCAGFVGRISPQKAVDRLIRVFASLYVDHPNLYLVIVGAGECLEDVKQLARTLEVADRVIFTGEANGAEQMAGMDMFVISSAYEAFPYVLLEAAALGLPIVSTCIGGASAVVREGETGYRVSADRLDDFARRIAELSTDTARRESMARLAREHAREFTSREMANRTICVYRDALSTD